MNITQCPFEELVSAWIDGELPEERGDELGQHLNQCPHCARAAQLFTALDVRLGEMHLVPPWEPVRSTQSMNVLSRPPNADAVVTGTANLRTRRSRRSTALAIAVSLIAVTGVSVMVWTSLERDLPRQASTENTDAPEFTVVVAPLSRLVASNWHSRQQQASSARTMELELRALRLDARASTDDAARLLEIESGIDSLIEQLDRLKQDDD